jgi:hypothetical protein
MKNFNSLSKDIRNAVALFAEFGSRNEYVRKGVTIIINDVTNPEQEGIYLARLARQIAKRQGVEYAHEWAMKAFTDGVYAKNERRNKPAPWSKFELKRNEKTLHDYLESCVA